MKKTSIGMLFAVGLFWAVNAQGMKKRKFDEALSTHNPTELCANTKKEVVELLDCLGRIFSDDNYRQRAILAQIVSYSFELSVGERCAFCRLAASRGGKTVLRWVVEFGTAQMTAQLLKDLSGEQKEVLFKDDISILTYPVKYGNFQQVQVLIQNLTVLQRYGLLQLFPFDVLTISWAQENEHIGALLLDGMTLTQRLSIFPEFRLGSNEQNALCSAAANNDLAAAKLLLSGMSKHEKYSLLKTPDSNQKTPLFYAVDRPNQMMVNLFIEDLNQDQLFEILQMPNGSREGTGISETVFHCAVKNYQIDITRRFVNKIAGWQLRKLIALRNSDGHTPLSCVVDDRNKEIFDLLFNKKLTSHIKPDANNLLHDVCELFALLEIKNNTHKGALDLAEEKCADDTQEPQGKSDAQHIYTTLKATQNNLRQAHPLYKFLQEEKKTDTTFVWE